LYDNPIKKGIVILAQRGSIWQKNKIKGWIPLRENDHSPFLAKST
jgi:hypothetical protein